MSEQPLIFSIPRRTVPFVRLRCENCGEPATVIDRLYFCGSCFLEETRTRYEPVRFAARTDVETHLP